MQNNRKPIVSSLIAVGLLFVLSAFTAAQTMKVTGMIISRTGDSMTLTTSSGNVVVTLDDSTKVQHPKGLIGVRKQKMSAAALIPGLKVKVDGTGSDPMHLTAKTVTFDSSDLETAEMIQAGLHPTAEQVATTGLASRSWCRTMAATT